MQWNAFKIHYSIVQAVGVIFLFRFNILIVIISFLSLACLVGSQLNSKSSVQIKARIFIVLFAMLKF